MAFDAGGVAVDAYANKFCRRMDDYIQSRKVSGNRERRIEMQLAYYPDPVTEVFLRVKHVDRSTVKTSVTYEENWSGDRWTCRWDRHENDHNARDHFHHPPSPDDNDDPYAYDADLGQGVLMMEAPVEFILDRITDLFRADSHVYPSSYEWTMDYNRAAIIGPTSTPSRLLG